MSQIIDRYAPLATVVVGIGGALAFTAAFPAVEGLGDKVRLPVFHGALTWVNLTLFSLMALAALVHLVSRSTRAYRLEEALRWVGITIWAIGSGLGLAAAMRTWDFTGSKSSPLSVALEDPRLVAHFWILLAALALAAMGLIFERRVLLACADLAFVAAMWTLILKAVLGPGRALHPDSPVLNSEEIRIKLIFGGIVVCLAIAAAGGTWMVAKVRSGREVTQVTL